MSGKEAGRVFTGDVVEKNGAQEGDEVAPDQTVMYLDYRMAGSIDTGTAENPRVYVYAGQETEPGENFGKAKYILKTE